MKDGAFTQIFSFGLKLNKCNEINIMKNILKSKKILFWIKIEFLKILDNLLLNLVFETSQVVLGQKDPSEWNDEIYSVKI